jgi:hypothetical protein
VSAVVCWQLDCGTASVVSVAVGLWHCQYFIWGSWIVCYGLTYNMTRNGWLTDRPPLEPCPITPDQLRPGWDTVLVTMDLNRITQDADQSSDGTPLLTGYACDVLRL